MLLSLTTYDRPVASNQKQ